jgi:hypothetical protein
LTKLYRMLMMGLFVLLLIQGGSFDFAKAQGSESHTYYFPLIQKFEQPRVDNFSGEDPEWTVLYMKNDPKDGFCERRDGVLYCEIQDNSAMIIAHPGWWTQGDFELEVKAHFDRPRDDSTMKTLNGLGIVFNGNEDWTKGYAFMLAYGGAQHHWALFRFDGRVTSGPQNGNPDITYLSKWGGAPSFVKNWDRWNRLKVRRIRDRIYLYCNGYRMPLPAPYYTYVQDSKYYPGGYVGIIITSYEAKYERIEFDNFALTPVSGPY